MCCCLYYMYIQQCCYLQLTYIADPHLMVVFEFWKATRGLINVLLQKMVFPKDVNRLQFKFNQPKFAKMLSFNQCPCAFIKVLIGLTTTCTFSWIADLLSSSPRGLINVVINNMLHGKISQKGQMGSRDSSCSLFN